MELLESLGTKEIKILEHLSVSSNCHVKHIECKFCIFNELLELYKIDYKKYGCMNTDYNTLKEKADELLMYKKMNII